MTDNEEFRFVPFMLRTLPRLIASQRALAYASEVGESFRPLIPVWAVRSSYAASIVYVAADVGHGAHQNWEAGLRGKPLAVKTGDRLLWHGLASLVLPAITVHSIVSLSQRMVNGTSASAPIKRWAPTGIALAAIPFIIHPVDQLSDAILDVARPFVQ